MSDIDIAYYICAILSFVPAIIVHEVSHGLAAYKLGDPTAKRQGRLSLNPLKHVDPFGTVIMPLLLMVMNFPIFGYAKPVPYNPSYFKNPRTGDVIVGLAGPAANLAMAIVGAILAWVLLPVAQGMASNLSGLESLPIDQMIFMYFYYYFLTLFVMVNLYLMFFNLLPIPPLDGSSIFAVLLPRKWLPQYYKIQRYALPVFFIVVIGLPLVLGVNPIRDYLQLTAGNLGDLLLP